MKGIHSAIVGLKSANIIDFVGSFIVYPSVITAKAGVGVLGRQSGIVTVKSIPLLWLLGIFPLSYRLWIPWKVGSLEKMLTCRVAELIVIKLGQVSK